MSSPFRFTALGLVLAMSVPVYAGNVASTLITETGKETSTSERSVLSESERARARTWNLSETEWQRYRQLMQGIRGSISPETISPIEVLGIHARDEAERQRYADAWARAMHEDVDRILAFQRAYDAAGRRLYPNEPLIDAGRLPVKAKSQQPVSRAIVYCFSPDSRVRPVMRCWRLIQKIDEISGIDIYLMGMAPGDDQAVRDMGINSGDRTRVGTHPAGDAQSRCRCPGAAHPG